LSAWDTLSLRFGPFEPVKKPLQDVLVVLETAEAILEALLALVKNFLQDFTNPLRSLIALLLAAVRTIINQLKATGFSILLVHPDFSRQDVSAVLSSVAGSYPNFESKVISKFFDQSDLNRPQYPDGSSVAMLVFYIAAETPGDLLLQIFALLRLIRHPAVVDVLPAPVELKVNPTRKSGDVISNFSSLFDDDLDQALTLEWRMPTTSQGSALPGFVNSLTSFYNSFRIFDFIVERSEHPLGELVQLELDTPTIGATTKSLLAKYGAAPPVSHASLREANGNTYRNFEKKIDVPAARLVEGQFTGTYKFLDSGLEEKKVYFYRVRAYLGNASAYIESTDASSFLGSDGKGDRTLTRVDGNNVVLAYPQGSVVGPASPIVRGFVPRKRSGSGGFNIYTALYRAVQAGLLLNFEFPAPLQSDTPSRLRQKAGWGTLAAAGGQIGPLKSAFNTSTALKSNVLFQTTARKFSNATINNLYSNPQLMNLLHNLWTGSNNEPGVGNIVDTIMDSTIEWKFVGIVGGVTSTTNAKIDAYLGREDVYRTDQPIDGPIPCLSPYKFKGQELYITDDDRRKLSEFLRSALISMSGQTSYLSWYSVTLGDLFPAFVPFIYDFEQFLLALMKAVDSVLKEIEDIIGTVLQKIRALEQLLRTIIQIIDLLSISVRVSVFAASSSNGSAQSLATAMMESENKPFDSPYGLHSGLVVTFGGPGAGSIAAFQALKFILTLGL